jgi:hypothetical protein
MTAPHTRQSQVLPGSAGTSATIWAVLAANASAVVLKELDAAFEHFPQSVLPGLKPTSSGAAPIVILARASVRRSCLCHKRRKPQCVRRTKGVA